MKVILLTHESNISRALANCISEQGINLIKVVIIRKNIINKTSKPSPPPSIIRKLLNKFKSFTTSKKIKSAYKAEQHFRAQANKILSDFIADKGNSIQNPEVEITYTENIQSEDVLTQLTEAQPDLFVVYGTPILKKAILSIPKLGTINAHTSILPEYRGSRSEFFQCYNQEYDHVGVTFHFVDTGVDTGRILYQHKTEIGTIPEPQVLRAKNTVATLQLFPNIIKKVLSNDIEPFSQEIGNTPTFKFSEMTYEKRMELYARIGKSAGL